MAATITKIEAQKRKGRYNIYLDGAYAFPVSEDVLIKFQIFKGMEVDDQLQETIKKADQVSKLYSRAIDFLAHNLRTEFEVREKLLTLSEDEDAIKEVIDRLKDQRLVDDQHYAQSYVVTVIRGRKNGPAWIRNHLKTKHIPEAMIDNTLTELFNPELQLEIASEGAVKNIKLKKNDSLKMVQNKTKNLLAQRGFSFDIASQAVQSVDLDEFAERDSEIIDKLAKRYSRKYAKYQGYEREQRLKQALYAKGFSMDDIQGAIERLAE
ncbi:recombination regulator RecX [Lentilactobacillus sp. SPB1-3]|uniref:Recombination regulator RecX n=1 Tax=Lentilactobacillus terminaliae TaxID=3003483 RepID=A0ACD5DG07_9LACO|nr:recombination regulator RecX [Lentilactobacillus sp. SPB1-3]MCZ0976840.1 recombination regulator RecX [Lentilactobacillus sp. SPB1-3]